MPPPLSVLVKLKKKKAQAASVPKIIHFPGNFVSRHTKSVWFCRVRDFVRTRGKLAKWILRLARYQNHTLRCMIFHESHGPLFWQLKGTFSSGCTRTPLSSTKDFNERKTMNGNNDLTELPETIKSPRAVHYGHRYQHCHHDYDSNLQNKQYTRLQLLPLLCQPRRQLRRKRCFRQHIYGQRYKRGRWSYHLQYHQHWRSCCAAFCQQNRRGLIV